MDIEYFSEHNENALNNSQKAVTEPVDHCILRQLNEISSDPHCIIPTTPPTLTESCKLPTSSCTPRLSLPSSNCLPPAPNKGCFFYKYGDPKVIHDSLKKSGYYIFKNMIHSKHLEIATKYVVEDKVNYYRLKKEFIDPFMLKELGKQIDRNIINMKSQTSNYNNSSDTELFHRDIHNYSKYKTTRIYTILTYLDGGTIEIIPESNNYKNLSLVQAINRFQTRVQNVLEPGDVLMFDASTIHRELFYNKQQNCRVIRLFDCVFDYDFDYYMKTITHVPCRNDCNDNITSNLLKLNKNNNFSNTLNQLVYLNAAIGYSKFGYKTYKSNDIYYISTETNHLRINGPRDKFYLNNHYIINVEGVKDIDSENRDMFTFLSFTLNYIIMLVVFIIFIALILLIVGIIINN